MDIKFSGSDAGGFQFDPNAAPKPKMRSYETSSISLAKLPLSIGSSA